MQNTTRVNYDELNIISKKFHDEGDDYAQLISSTRQKMAALRSDWEGDAADKFFDEMENILLPALNRLSQGLIVSQEVLSKIMKTIYEADQETGSYFQGVEAGGEDFGAGMFNAALGAGSGTGAGGEDFGAGLFNQAGGAAEPGTGADGGPSETTDHFKISGSAVEVFQTPEAEAQPAAEIPPGAASAGGGGGGGGGSSSGLQGDLKGLGSGLGGQPGSSASVGGSSGGAESLPDHVFGGGGSAVGGGASGSGLPSQGGGSGAEVPASSGSEGVTAGIAGVVGSAAVGGAAKIIKDKQEN
ncbi:MAG: WXG100 family type VII secretion target [Chloroflexi bacterium]|nr:WXG100 family type VII secretion target [Chloroflexota bacterium]